MVYDNIFFLEHNIFGICDHSLLHVNIIEFVYNI